MWLINFLPIDLMLIVVHGILAVGLVGLLISFASRFFPVIGVYSLPIRIISTIIIIVGVYLEGVVSTHQWYQAEVKEMSEKLKKAEAESKQLNERLTIEIQKNDQIITNHTNTIRTEIREKLVPLDGKCELDPLVVSLLNRSAANPLAADNSAKPEGEAQ